jgi:hypothetical protein
LSHNIEIRCWRPGVNWDERDILTALEGARPALTHDHTRFDPKI